MTTIACAWQCAHAGATLSSIDILLLGNERPRDNTYAGALEKVVAQCLHHGGVWSSPRQSDGVPWFRIVARDDAHLRVCGRIFTIGQVEHTFWLDVTRDPGKTSGASLTLHFNADTSALSPRAARSVLESIDAPSDVRWSVTVPTFAA
jgi:hypothetical protein